MLSEFDADADRLAVLSQCTENFDIGDPDAEWPNNILSRKLIVYGSGRIARLGQPVRHYVDPDELALCQQLAAEVANVMAGVEVGMGSEAGDPFRPFYIAANADDGAPEAIDEALIRSMFAGTIFPPATITVEPLAEAGRWWQEVEEDACELEGEELQAYLRPWRAMIQWFAARPELKAQAFIRIGDFDALHALELKRRYPKGTEMPGCVLPRLAVGLTRSGSLVGLFGYSVQT